MRAEWRLGVRDQIVIVQFVCLYKKLGLYLDNNRESVKAFKQRYNIRYMFKKIILAEE